MKISSIFVACLENTNFNNFDYFLNTSNHFKNNVVWTTALAKTTNTKLRSYSTCLFTFHACVAPFSYYTPYIGTKKNSIKMKPFMFLCEIKMERQEGIVNSLLWIQTLRSRVRIYVRSFWKLLWLSVEIHIKMVNVTYLWQIQYDVKQVMEFTVSR